MCKETDLDMSVVTEIQWKEDGNFKVKKVMRRAFDARTGKVKKLEGFPMSEKLRWKL